MKDDKELGVNRDWGDGWNNRELDVRQAKFVDRDSSRQNAILYHYQRQRVQQNLVKYTYGLPAVGGR